ncbi:MAG: DNA polymerase III subunit gamma/tau [Clostridiales bacterium]|nr:DNA polymerase III subunit gamma/tau [Clostridiales bacterium]
MGYTALYRKFRPITFSEIVGQEHITRTLRNQIVAGRVGHAYLFNGGRGTGKTSAAKILARAINCLNPQDGEPCNECEICKGAINGSLTDIVEMDAASNNSVEDIRSIREEVNFLPTKAKYRVYIIDEVHMLSTGAFNALLKTLEEPPEHVKFILATTEPQKLPATILSRCQRFDFKRISNENIIKRLNIVCEQSGIEITKEAMNIIAVLAEGAMRDALSILERCIQDGENKIDEDKIKDLVGIPKITYVHNIIDSLFKYDVDNTLKNVDIVLNEGKDINNLLWEMIKYTKDLLVYKASQKLDLYSEEEIANIEEISKNISKQDLINMVYELSELENDIKWSTQKTIIFQAGMIKLCNKEKTENKGLEERVEKIEKYLKSGKIGVVQNSAVMGANAQQARTTSAPNNFSPRATMAGGTQATQTRRANTNTAKKMETRNYSSDAKQYWPEILTDLKQNGKIVLYTNLINTQAKEINDMTVGIEFKNGMSAFGKTVLEKPENVREISKMVSMACGKPMDIKYISNDTQVNQISQEESLQQFANDSDIPFNVIE